MFRFLATAIILAPQLLFGASIEENIQNELALFNLPATVWRIEEDSSMLDVAIIGAGQAGLAIGHALQLEGIENVQIFDAAYEGEEGPWLTSARMLTLRTGKQLRGPAQLPHLTYQAWHIAEYGKESWEVMNKIPTESWGNYLRWLRNTTGIHVANNAKLISIKPHVDDSLTLGFEDGKQIRCRKVVLATGRSGFGGASVPSFIENLPKQYWAHTSEVIDPQFFRDKRIAVIGVGASGFDVAASALEHEAKSVEMLMRRQKLPQVNHASQFAYPGFMRGFYHLTDWERHDFFDKVLSEGIPPPQESIERISSYSNFSLISSCQITDCQLVENYVKIGERAYDFVVLATGYAVDGKRVEALKEIADKILLWQDKIETISPRLGPFAYLGPHFEFLEKEKGSATYLKNIHCFNYGGYLSHGRICGELDGLHIGIDRLVEGVVIDLFLQDTCRNNGPTPNECPGTCQIGLCSPFSLQIEGN